MLLYYDRIDAPAGTDSNKISESKKCNICHYWYFLDKGFTFQPNVCNRCHNLFRISMNLTDFAILNIKRPDYCCIISGISKSEAVNLMQNTNLIRKGEHYKI